MSREGIEVPALSAEFSEVDLGDVRLNRRLGLLADRLGERYRGELPQGAG
jgi:Transposase DNA-binding